MVNINQTISPSSDPNYLQYSKGISQPDADKTAGIALKGAGDLFADVVKAGDMIVKDHLATNIRKDIETERDAYTSALSQVKEDVKSGKTPMNILPATEGTDEVPADLEHLSTELSTVKGAKEARKISSTDYIGRVDGILRKYRNQFPGYKDYIDQQGHAVSGMDPANAYYKSIIQDINRSLTGADAVSKRTDAMIDEAVKKGIPNADTMFRMRQQGLPQGNDANVRSWYNQNMQRFFKRDSDKAVLETDEIDRKQKENLSKDGLNDFSAQQVGDYYSNIFTGTDKNVPPEISASATKLMSGKTMTENEARQLGSYVAAYRGKLETSLWNEANRTGYVKWMGEDAARKMISGHMNNFDVINKLIYDNNTGQAEAAARWLKSHTNEASKNLFQDTKLGDWATKSAVLKQLGGDQAFEPLFGAILKGKYLGDIQSYVGNKLVLDPATQPNKDKTGEVVVIKNIIDNAKAKGILSGDMLKDILSIPNAAKDPRFTDEVKENLMLSAFHPNNLGMISKLNRDGQVMVNGRPVNVPGQYFTFRDFTSDEMTAEVARLAKNKPIIGAYYDNWLKTTFGKELFAKEIETLKDIQVGAAVGLGWDEKNKRFIPPKEDKAPQMLPGFKTKPTDRFSAPLVNQEQGLKDARDELNRSINRLNIGLASVKSWAAASGQDVETYLLETLNTLGYTPNLPGMNIPEHITRAIMVGKSREEFLKQQKEKQKTQAKEYGQ